MIEKAEDVDIHFKKLTFIKTKKQKNKKINYWLINKIIKQWFSYINKSISVSNLSFNFMSMLTWLYNHLPNVINKKGAYFIF